jgi:hypothetical protein
MAFSNIKISVFKGSAIKPYLTSIARMRVEIFNDYPHLRKNELDYEINRLREYTETPDSIAVIVFDGSTPVGAALGIPLELEMPDLQRPLLERGLNLNEYYYFGKSIILNPYRGRGIGHHLFELREQHALNLKRFKYTCFWDVVRPENHPLKPSSYMSLVDFWRKLGYVKCPDLTFTLSWKDLEEDEASAKETVYWVKELRN